MKLVRFGPPGREKPGILDEEGRLRDLSGIVPDIAGDVLSPKGLEKIRKARPDRLPLVRGKPRLGPCVGRVPTYYAIGLNYADHAAESNSPIPSEPVVFIKANSCICGPNDDTMMPKGCTKLDYEVELGVVIGQRARYIASKRAAMDHVAGYCVCNDVSERAFQMERGQTMMKGKGSETFGPIGPWLVTKDEIKDPQRLAMWSSVNGEPRQNGTTKTMIFGVAHLVWYLSQFFVLEPGDVIATGTPPGVALGMKPAPVWLKAGDVVRMGIDGLGEQEQRIVRFRK
ncbi:MAG TPA: fumarylacetoacetate hydrolase family protein [Xanthobacteraceae bacterium]|nr:fumarylacetoacetate hydrolase family protein [Xanthobacteraceae bacterium]